MNAVEKLFAASCLMEAGMDKSATMSPPAQEAPAGVVPPTAPHPIRAGIGAIAVPILAQLGTYAAVTKALAARVLSPEAQKASDILKRLARRKGYEPVSVDAYIQSQLERTKEMAEVDPNWTKNLSKTIERQVGHGAVAPKQHTTQAGRAMQGFLITPEHVSPGVAGHEVGHIVQPKQLRSAWARAGLMGAGLGSWGPLLTGDEDTGRNTALAGAALALPGVVGELDASVRGAGLARRLGMNGRGAFTGIPTYAIAMAAPLLTHYTKKLLGGYTPENPQT